MPNECILTILECLNILELRSVADVSKLFRVLAKKTFKCKFENVDVDIDLHTPTYSEELEHLLDMFGNDIVRFKISGNSVFDVNFNNVLRFLNVRFTRLKKLILSNIDFDSNSFELSQELFNRLSELNMSYCTMTNIDWCCMNSLTVLHLDKLNCTWFERMPPNCDNVIELVLKRLNITHGPLRRLLERMPAIKKLSITHCHHISMSILHEVLMLELVELEFQLNCIETPSEIEINLNVLPLYMSLKILKINFGGGSMLDLFNAFSKSGIQFEELELANGIMGYRVGEVIGNQLKLRQLKLNNLIRCHAGHIFNIMWLKSSELEALYVKTECEIPQCRIVDILKAGKKLKFFAVDAKEFHITVDTFNAFEISKGIDFADRSIKSNNILRRKATKYGVDQDRKQICQCVFMRRYSGTNGPVI